MASMAQATAETQNWENLYNCTDTIDSKFCSVLNDEHEEGKYEYEQACKTTLHILFSFSILTSNTDL